jgi:hypothetical protein
MRHSLWFKEPHYAVLRETPDDHPLTHPFALTLATLAAHAVTNFFRTGVCHEFEITWNDLKVQYRAQSEETSGPLMVLYRRQMRSNMPNSDSMLVLTWKKVDAPGFRGNTTMPAKYPFFTIRTKKSMLLFIHL